MTAHAEDMVLVARAELDALRAENRRLRREAGDREASDLQVRTHDTSFGTPQARLPPLQHGELMAQDQDLGNPPRFLTP